jgi:hypothetical protein
MSGRNNTVDIHASFHTTVTAEDLLRLGDSSDSTRAVDGITMQSQNTSNGLYRVNDQTGNLGVTTATNATGNKILGAFTTTAVDDGGTGNTFDINGSLATPVPHITGRFQVRYGDTGSGISTTATDFVLDADHNAGTPIIRLLGSVDNNIDTSSGNLRINSNLAMSLIANASASNIVLDGSAYVLTGASGATGYTRPMYLGSYALWVASNGKLYIKSGAPSSDTDGTVVGTQA